MSYPHGFIQDVFTRRVHHLHSVICFPPYNTAAQVHKLGDLNILETGEMTWRDSACCLAV